MFALAAGSSPGDEAECEAALASSDDQVRLQALDCVESSATWTRLATSDPYWRVRRAATRRVDDQGLLAKIAQTDSDSGVRIVAIGRLADPRLLSALALSDPTPAARLAAAEALSDDAALGEIFSTSRDSAVRAAVAPRLPAADLERVLADPAARVRLAVLDRLSTPRIAALAALDPALEVRVAAVERLTDTSLLARIAGEDGEASVRLAAVARLTDEAVLLPIATSDPALPVRLVAISRLPDAHAARAFLADAEPGVRLAAARRLGDPAVLDGLARRDPEPEVRRGAVAALPADSAALAAIALADPDPTVGLAAVVRLGDPQALAAVVWHSPFATSREEAIDRLTDAGALATVAIDHPLAQIRLRATERLTDPSALARVAQSDADRFVRLAAALALENSALLRHLTVEDPSREVRQAALSRLSGEADLLSVALGAGHAAERRAAAARLRDERSIERVLATVPDRDIRAAALAALDPASAGRVAAESSDPWTRRMAAAVASGEGMAESAPPARHPLTGADLDPALPQAELARLARESEAPSVRLAAILRLQDSRDLAAPARDDREWYLRRAAVERTGDAELLLDRALHDPHLAVRRSAALRRLDLGAGLPPQEVPAANSAAADSPLRHQLEALIANPAIALPLGPLDLDLRVSGEGTSYADRSVAAPPTRVPRGVLFRERVGIRILDREGRVLVDREFVGQASRKVTPATEVQPADDQAWTEIHPADVDLVEVAADLLATLAEPAAAFASALPAGDDPLAVAARLTAARL